MRHRKLWDDINSKRIEIHSFFVAYRDKSPWHRPVAFFCCTDYKSFIMCPIVQLGIVDLYVPDVFNWFEFPLYDNTTLKDTIENQALIFWKIISAFKKSSANALRATILNLFRINRSITISYNILGYICILHYSHNSSACCWLQLDATFQGYDESLMTQNCSKLNHEISFPWPWIRSVSWGEGLIALSMQAAVAAWRPASTAWP